MLSCLLGKVPCCDVEFVKCKQKIFNKRDLSTGENACSIWTQCRFSYYFHSKVSSLVSLSKCFLANRENFCPYEKARTNVRVANPKFSCGMENANHALSSYISLEFRIYFFVFTPKIAKIYFHSLNVEIWLKRIWNVDNPISMFFWRYFTKVASTFANIHRYHVYDVYFAHVISFNVAITSIRRLVNTYKLDKVI